MQFPEILTYTILNHPAKLGLLPGDRSGNNTLISDDRFIPQDTILEMRVVANMDIITEYQVRANHGPGLNGDTVAEEQRWSQYHVMGNMYLFTNPDVWFDFGTLQRHGHPVPEYIHMRV